MISWLRSAAHFFFLFSGHVFLKISPDVLAHRPVRPTIFTLSSPSSCLRLSVLLLLHPVLSVILASSCHLCHPGFILSCLSSWFHPALSVILTSSCHLCHPGFILSFLSSWLHPVLSVILATSCSLCHPGIIMSTLSSCHYLSALLLLHPVLSVILTSPCPLCHPGFILSSLSSWLHPVLSVILTSSFSLCHPGFILPSLSSWLHPAHSVILSSQCPFCHPVFTSLSSCCFILPSLASWPHPLWHHGFILPSLSSWSYFFPASALIFLFFCLGNKHFFCPDFPPLLTVLQPSIFSFYRCVSLLSFVLSCHGLSCLRVFLS
jgi:hypothetical protein